MNYNNNFNQNNNHNNQNQFNFNYNENMIETGIEMEDMEKSNGNNMDHDTKDLLASIDDNTNLSKSLINNQWDEKIDLNGKPNFLQGNFDAGALNDENIEFETGANGNSNGINNL